MSGDGASRPPAALVIGGCLDGLIAATTLANSGRRVVLVEQAAELGGARRTIEFAPGHRAAPLAEPTGRALTILGEDGTLSIGDSIEATARGIARWSSSDAARWPVFAQTLDASAGFLAGLYRAPPPRIDAGTLGEFLALAGAARRFRKLGRAGMRDFLRILPMPVADLLEDEFETPLLQGALAAMAVRDIAQGPGAAGTVFALLHRLATRTRATNVAGLKHWEDRARAAGVTIRLHTAVRRLEVSRGRLTGAVLDSGAALECDVAISALDPYASLLDLIDPKHHDPEFIHAVRHIRFRGVATKVLLAMDALPALPGMASPGGDQSDVLRDPVVIAPSIRYVERAHEASKYGSCPEEPWIEVGFPSLVRPDLAPAGRHVAVLHVQYTPYGLRDDSWARVGPDVADRALGIVDRYLPGFAARVRQSRVLAPPELESELGVREGSATQGELALDQVFFMRPVPAASRYATPIEGFYLCGPGTHPGASGWSGELAARAAIARVRWRS